MDPSPQFPDRRPAARRLRLLAAALVLGVVVATAAVTFLAACQVVTRLALTAAAGYRPGEPAGEELLVPDTAGGPFRPWLLVPVAAAGGLVAGWLVHRLAPESAGPGTDAVIRAYHQSDGRVRGRVAAVKILTTAVTIGTGGSGGREGPMVQVGAGLGSWLAGRLGLGPADRRVLLAAGVAAGVAAVFRAPLAGALFAAEVLYRSGEFESEVLIPAGTAAVAADAVAGLALGWGPLLPAAAGGPAAPSHLPAYGLLAVVVTVFASLYVSAFHTTTGWFRRLRLPGPVKPALGAGTAALLGVGLYFAAGRDERTLAVLGFGFGTLQEALARPDGFTAGLLLAVALGKLATTCLTIGSGGSGGVFGPALVIGGCGGAALGLLFRPLGPVWAPPPAACALLGMAGFFAAAAKTPFSTLVIVCEITGEFGLVAPALSVCVGCFVLSGRASLFESQPASRADSPAHRPIGAPSSSRGRSTPASTTG
jgi:CIC family chloride channel protein